MVQSSNLISPSDCVHSRTEIHGPVDGTAVNTPSDPAEPQNPAEHTKAKRKKCPRFRDGNVLQDASSRTQEWDEISRCSKPPQQGSENSHATRQLPSSKSEGVDTSTLNKIPSDGILRLTDSFKGGCIRFAVHTKNAVCSSYINLLLVFVPIGIAVKFAGMSPQIVFSMNAIAIIPLAGLLAKATESVAKRLGDTLGALLNVSFGNAVELIIL